jgi:hypothetical protein
MQKASQFFLVIFLISCYISLMTIMQTVVVPDSHRLTINVPHEVPTGTIMLTFTPAGNRKEHINNDAELLNMDAEDLLEYQNLDALEDDLERFTSQEYAVIHGAVVTFNFEDIVVDRGEERINLASGKEYPV